MDEILSGSFNVTQSGPSGVRRTEVKPRNGHAHAIKLQSLVMLALVSLWLCARPVFGASTICQIAAKSAAVHLEASVSSTVFATLPQGTMVDIVESGGEWILIKFKDNSANEKVGYVRKDQVRIIGGSSGSSTTTSPQGKRGSSSVPMAPADVDVPAEVLSDDGCYLVQDSGVVRIEAKTPYQTRSGSSLLSGLTLGIKPTRLNTMLPSVSAELQLTANPHLYLHIEQGESIGEYYLVRFTVKISAGRRELEIGSASFWKAQAGFADKDLFLLDTKRVAKDIYLVSPKVALPGGEYGLLQIPQITSGGQAVMTPKKIFDFGVR